VTDTLVYFCLTLAEAAVEEDVGVDAIVVASAVAAAVVVAAVVAVAVVDAGEEEVAMAAEEGAAWRVVPR
jgi:hypothetical protein